MHVQMDNQITINAPAHDVWRVLAHEFGDVDQWASSVTESNPMTDVPIPEGAKVGGRAFFGQSFGDVQEVFTYYDEQSMRYGYTGLGDLPWFLNSAENNWRVRSLDPNKSVVETKPNIDLKLLPGLFLIPIFKFQFGKIGQQLLEELKYYIEQGQPHPRKLKQQ